MNLIISLAVNGRENYVARQLYLIKTLDIVPNCDRWIFNEYPKGVTPQDKVPYKFKYDLIKQAYEQGYKKVWWLDSTMRLINNPFLLFDGREIVAFDNIGHPTYKYITDLAIKNLDCKDYIKDVKNSWGGALGFDFEQPKTISILNEILHQSEIGTFDNGVGTHEGYVAARHDQSCNSVIFHNNGIKLLDYGVIAAKQHKTKDTYIQYGD